MGNDVIRSKKVTLPLPTNNKKKKKKKKITDFLAPTSEVYKHGKQKWC